MSTEHYTFTLHELGGDVRVTKWTGKESMSSPYHFDLFALVDADEGFVRRALGSSATLSIHFDGAPARAVHGVVSSCKATGHHEAGRAAFVLRLAPRLIRMKKRRTSRIFQDQTTREIVEQVLALSHVPNRWHLANDLPKRAYCVQYDETDYAFVARLCASDGIFFSFEHPIDACRGEAHPEEILVLSDTADAYRPIDGRFELRFHADGAGGSALTIEEDHLQAFRLRHAIRKKRVLLRRFDFEKPPIPRRDAAGIDENPHLDHDDAMRAFVDAGATLYEHQQTREQALLEPTLARIALEAETADAALAEAETTCRRLLPGRRFRVVDHALSELDGEYVVVSCAHEGVAPEWAQADRPIYTNRFEAVPARVPFRPERPRRKVRQSLETATVVGPPGQEIHTDAFGRIKVQFHWDLQGRHDETSSCWLRVAQPWAGSGYGAQFLPRVGHEVLVGYIDGDADRPIVLGSLHNGLNPTPFSFPRDSERSGIKTRTTPGGKGGHELLFDDRAGAELVSLRSNRTMDLSAAGDAALRAEGNLRVVAGADRMDEVLRDASMTVGGIEHRKTEGSRYAQVGGGDTLEVQGDRHVTVGGEEVRRVGGPAVQIFSGSRTAVVGASRDEVAHDYLGVSGQYKVSSVHEMSLASRRRIQLECGESRITLLPDRILLESPTIQLQAKERIALVQGDPPEATVVLQGSASISGGTVVAKGGGKDGGKLVLDAEAHLDGAFVKLNCGAGGGAGGSVIHSEDEKGKVRFTVRREGVPEGVTSATLVIATPSGEVVERECPVGGTVEMEGRPGEVFTVVETRIGDQPVPVQKKASAPEIG